MTEGWIIMSFFSKLFASIGRTSANIKPTQLKANKNRIICVNYSVKGKNPTTGRRKTVCVVVESTASQEEIQVKSGLLPPYEININDCKGTPSEAQIRYAEKLGFVFPADAGSDDASIFLTRAENKEPLVQPAMPDDLIRYLTKKGIHVPAYAGINEADRLYLYNVSQEEKYAYFCMRVYCDIMHCRYRLLEELPSGKRAIFDKFAELAIKDPDFIKSFLHYDSNDLSLSDFKKMKKLKAYNIANDFLRAEGVV